MTFDLSTEQFSDAFRLSRTFSATSRTDCTLVPYRFPLYCPASMN